MHDHIEQLAQALQFLQGHSQFFSASTIFCAGTGLSDAIRHRAGLRGGWYSPFASDGDALRELPAEISKDVLFVPGKDHEENTALLGALLQRMSSHARLFMIAPTTSGGKRYRELLISLGVDLLLNESKARCVVCGGVVGDAFRRGVAQGAFAQYEPFISPSSNLWVMHGLFSIDAIDPGTALLASQVHLKPGDSVCDLGCGYGGLLTSVIDLLPEQMRTSLGLVGIDYDARALRCAQDNLRARGCSIGLHHFDLAAPGFPLAGEFDVVISNPPQHTQGLQNLSMPEAFAQYAVRLVAPTGRISFVLNEHLPVPEALAGSTEIARSNGYKVVTKKFR